MEVKNCKVGFISHDPLDHELIRRVDIGISNKESDITIQ